MIKVMAYNANIELVLTVKVEPGKPGRMGKDPDDSCPPTGTCIEIMSALANFGGKEVRVPDWLVEGLLKDQEFIATAKKAMEEAGE